MNSNQPTYNTLVSERNLLRLLTIAIAAAVLISVVLAVLAITGFGTLKLDIPSGATASLNGHRITSSTLKLRPGSYQLAVSSPTTAPLQQTITVNLFRTTIYKPSLQPRQVDAIASSLLGALSGSTQAPHLIGVRWYANNTWLVALAMPGSAPLALHYGSNHQWTIEYYLSAGYPDDTSGLPSDVAAYVNQLEAQNATSTH